MRAGSHIVTVCMAVNREPYLYECLSHMAQRAADKKNLCCVLWSDGDPMADSFRHEIDGMAVVMGRNESQVGVGFSRHRAIMLVENGVVVVTDPHVSVPDGWDQMLRNHFAREDHARDVVCTKTRCVGDYDGLYGTAGGVVHGGADFVLYGEDGHTFCSPVARWADYPPGEIPCVMGGFYAFDRAWYTRIGEPLWLLRGWGCDEEMLSIGSWLCGGRVVMLDAMVSHLIRAATPAPTSFVLESIVNRMRLPMLLPASDTLRGKMMNWVLSAPVSLSQDFMARLARDANRREVAYLRNLWASKRDGWRAFAKRFLGVEDAGREVPFGEAGIVTHHNLPICPKCGRVDSLKNVRYAGSVRYAKCVCGISAKQEYEGATLRITWGPGAKNRKKRG